MLKVCYYLLYNIQTNNLLIEIRLPHTGKIDLKFIVEPSGHILYYSVEEQSIYCYRFSINEMKVVDEYSLVSDVPLELSFLGRFNYTVSRVKEFEIYQDYTHRFYHRNKELSSIDLNYFKIASFCSFARNDDKIFTLSDNGM
jgi:hypothetical protein